MNLRQKRIDLIAGGLVKEGSVRRDNLTVHFMITDTARDVPVTYSGTK